tara:strand:+ start:378 stop:542 length:165 start_codon:yes stop_codon:yes gene_type:complete
MWISTLNTFPTIVNLPGQGKPGPPPPPSEFFVIWEDGSELEMQNGIDKVLTQNN